MQGKLDKRRLEVGSSPSGFFFLEQVAFEKPIERSVWT